MTRAAPPTLAELAEAPELAALEALRHCAELAARALISMHPELADPDHRYWPGEPSQERKRGEAILNAVAVLRVAVDNYRRHAATAPRFQQP